MKTTLVFFSLLIANAAQAQVAGLVVKLAPLSAIDIASFPAVQGGVERSLSRRMSWYNEFGIRYAKGLDAGADTGFVSTKGWKAKSELRYYFLPDSKTRGFQPLEGWYFAANLFFIRDVHNATGSYFYQRDTAQRRVDNFGVNKIVTGINLLAGDQLSLGKAFLLDVYGGFGCRYRHIETINKEFDQNRDKLIEPVDVTIAGVKSHAEAFGGKTLLPNLTLGLRFGYKF